MKHQKVTRYLNNPSTGSGRRFRAIGHLGQAGGHGMCGRNGFSHFAEVADGASYIACSADSGIGTEGTENGYSDGIFSGDNGGS